MLKKFNEMDNGKKILIVVLCAIILIVFIFLFSYFKNQGIGYNDIKEDSKKALVYTKSSTENSVFRAEVPYLNIKDNYAKIINEDIDLFVNGFNGNSKLMLSYEYNLNSSVLSLLIKAVDYDTEDVPKVYFKTYNIDLNNKVVLTDDQLLSNYNVSFDDVNSVIESKFMNWYQDITKEGYFDENECDYECFLEYREVEDYLDNVVYYIDSGNLVLYKPFVFYSIYGEEEYFKEEDFMFVIVKRES